MTVKDWSQAFCRRRWAYGRTMGPIQRGSYLGRSAGIYAVMNIIFRRLRVQRG